MVKKALQESELKPNYLELEVTEATIMLDVSKTKELFQHLKGMGVQISIDHFGMGYTSINHFKDLPITTVKIDQNYVKGIPSNSVDTAVTGAMINLGHSLGLKVVAEGIETAEQLQFISQQNCDVVQGYFLSYPVSATNIIEQLLKSAEKEENII
jgi:EAL domain-containing protein (putative c-di-GMP-specific phosphodiesterase class I)